jgi:hypothetical protein
VGGGGDNALAFYTGARHEVGFGGERWLPAGLRGCAVNGLARSCHAGPAPAGHAMGLIRPPLLGRVVPSLAGLGWSLGTAQHGLRAGTTDKLSWRAKNIMFRAGPLSTTRMARYTQMLSSYMKSNVTKHITPKLFYPHELQVNVEINILQTK